MMLSAAALAAAMDLDPPTDQQAAAIEAPLEPSVLVAGAGSGKTATMAARVVWLVANGLVRPEQVLGLTFTRKAARELAARIRRRLAQARALDLVPPEWLAGGDPQVSTYDAYTARLVGEHGLRLGVEPARRLVGPSVAWQVAAQVVHAYDGPMQRVDKSHAWVVEQVLALHGELAGHLVDPERLRAFAADLRRRCSRLPRSPGQRREFLKAAGDAFARQDEREAILPMVAAYRAALADHDPLWIDYASQAALGAELARRFPAVGEGERRLFPVVLLDEYQDTSFAQLSMLRGLFGGGHPVTAVGDPCQSVYGWRGASTGSLAAFPEDFPRADGSPAPTHYLTTSFRNAPLVLAAANTLSEPLRADGFDVPRLTAAAASLPGRVVASWHATSDEEAAAVAAELRALIDEDPATTAAVLVRTRRQIERLVPALDASGVAYQVIGVGGLLATPEVADVVAALTVAGDASRGDALMRLLTGPPVRLGPRDLRALAALARRRSGDAAGPSGAAQGLDEPSIIEALDALPGSGPPGTGPQPGLSVAGRERAVRLREDLRVLRKQAGQPLPDLVAETIRTLAVDVEALAARGPGGRANLDRFLDVAAAFAAGNQAPTLPAFLAYLEAAASEESGLTTAEADVPAGGAGVVQVLTVHAAKGLEWDVVYVVGLVENTFPVRRGTAKGWLGEVGSLPYPLRGDAHRLPAFAERGATSHADLAAAVERFYAEADAAAVAEERRLAYVATTRARRSLSLSGYRWSDGSRPREPSTFLLEAREVPGVHLGVWADQTEAENPLAGQPRTATWPARDLLGGRGPAAARAAEMVRAAAACLDDPPEARSHPSPWALDVDLLLRDIQRRRQRPDAVEVPLPRHLSVTRLVQLGEGRDRLAMDLRRPLPVPPAPLARRGTAFHAWLEQRWGRAGLLDIDELPGAADETAAGSDDLDELRRSFLRSEWADRTPLEIESPFELHLGGILLRGQGDAVFRRDDGGLEVVDWKTGPPAKSAERARQRAVQLAAYRLAFASLAGLRLEAVSAAFHHVRENVTIRPSDLLDEASLAALVLDVPIAAGG